MDIRWYCIRIIIMSDPDDDFVFTHLVGCPTIICCVLPIITIVVTVLWIIFAGIVTGAVFGAKTSIERAHDPIYGNCSSSYSYECLVTDISQESIISNYEVHVKCYRNGNYKGADTYNFDSSEMEKHDIFYLYDNNETFSGYCECNGYKADYDYCHDIKFNRQQKKYDAVGYATLATVCILFGLIAGVITFVLTIIDAIIITIVLPVILIGLSILPILMCIYLKPVRNCIRILFLAVIIAPAMVIALPIICILSVIFGINQNVNDDIISISETKNKIDSEDSGIYVIEHNV